MAEIAAGAPSGLFFFLTGALSTPERTIHRIVWVLKVLIHGDTLCETHKPQSRCASVRWAGFRSKVCSRWNFLAHHRHLWSRLHVHVSLDDGDVVVEEHATEDRSCTRMALNDEAAATSKRKTLTGINKTAMLMQHAAAIRHLRVTGGRDWTRDDPPYRDLLPVPFRHVRHLDLSHNTRLPPEVIVRLVASQPLVQTLNLGRCAQLTDDALRRVTESARRLREVSLAHCRLLTNASIERVAEAWRELTVLDLTGCVHVTASAIGALVRNGAGAQLRVLRLRGVRGLSDELLATVATHCPHLVELDASDPNPFGPMPSFATSASTGAHRTGEKRSDYNEEEDESGGTPLSSEAITDAGVQCLARQCPRLESLRLHAQRALTDAGMGVALAGLPNLRWLDLRHCPVGDAALAALAASSSSSLRVLQLHRARAVTDAGVAQLRRLHNLRRVELSGSKRVSVDGLLAWLRERPVEPRLELWAGGIPSIQEMDAPPSVHVRNQ